MLPYMQPTPLFLKAAAGATAPCGSSVRPVDDEAGAFYTSIVIERWSQPGFAESGREERRDHERFPARGVG